MTNNDINEYKVSWRGEDNAIEVEWDANKSHYLDNWRLNPYHPFLNEVEQLVRKKAIEGDIYLMFKQNESGYLKVFVENMDKDFMNYLKTGGLEEIEDMYDFRITKEGKRIDNIPRFSSHRKKYEENVKNYKTK